jgi:hypothetical protein
MYDTAEADTADPGENIPREQAARRANRSPATLAAWAVAGDGPPTFKYRGRSWYPARALDAWVKARAERRARARRKAPSRL